MLREDETFTVPFQNLAMTVYPYSASIEELEAGGLEVQDHGQVLGKFETSQGCMRCQNKTKLEQ